MPVSISALVFSVLTGLKPKEGVAVGETVGLGEGDAVGEAVDEAVGDGVGVGVGSSATDMEAIAHRPANISRLPTD